MQKTETLKKVEGDYYASNYGIIYRRTKEGRFRPLRNYLMPTGYYRVSLSINGKLKRCYVHRLVAQAFIPNPNKLPEIDHIDTIRTNNSIYNLRWVSSKENSSNPISLEHYCKGNRKKAQEFFGYTDAMSFVQYVPIYDNNKQNLCAFDLNVVYKITYELMPMWSIRGTIKILRKEGFDFRALHFKEDGYSLVKKISEPNLVKNNITNNVIIRAMREGDEPVLNR